MENDASDVKIPVGLLLPGWHPPSLKMAAIGFLEAPKPKRSQSHSLFNAAIEPTNPSRMTQPICSIRIVRVAHPPQHSNIFYKNVAKTGKRISETPPPTLMP
jgi:hypothetical protein